MGITKKLNPHKGVRGTKTGTEVSKSGAEGAAFVVEARSDSRSYKFLV